MSDEELKKVANEVRKGIVTGACTLPSPAIRAVRSALPTS